jgi:hypothetical protein
MANPLSRGERKRSTHPEEWLSILISFVVTFAAIIFIWQFPDYKPATAANGGMEWTIPVWIGFFYVISQIVFLLISASQVRALGVVDSVVAIVPVIAGLVSLVEAALGHLVLSTFQWTTLMALLVAGTSEFLLTLWIRFVINRRTIGFDQTDGA